MISRKINRRRFVQGTAGLTTAVAASSTFYVPMINAQEKQPVTAWTTHSDDDLKSIQSIVEEFNAQSTTTEVKLEQVPGSETDSAKLVTAVRGGTGPDAYMLDRFVVPERAANGLLQDLTPLLEGAGFDPDLKSTYIEFAANEASYQGKPFALPFDSDARGLYVNVDLLTEAGADPAAYTLDADPVTWDEFKEVMAKLNVEADSGNFERFGFVPWMEQGWHYTYGFSWGADFFDEEACEVTPDSEQMIAAMQWIYDYSKEFGPDKMQAAITVQEGAPPSENPFVTNRVGAMITGDWWIKLMERYAPDLNYQIAKIPVPEAGMESATWAGGWSWVVPQGAKNPEGAAEFLIYMAGEPGQTVYTRDTAHLPTVAALMDKAELYDERHAEFSKILLPLAKNRPPLPVGAKYWDELTAAYERIYLNEQEPAESLAQAKENTMTLLSQFCPIE